MQWFIFKAIRFKDLGLLVIYKQNSLAHLIIDDLLSHILSDLPLR